MGREDQIDFLYKYKHDVTAAVLGLLELYTIGLKIFGNIYLWQIEQGNDEKPWKMNSTIFEMHLSIKCKNYTLKLVNYIRRCIYRSQLWWIKKAAEMKNRVNEYFANITEFEEKCVEINDEEEGSVLHQAHFPLWMRLRQYLIRIINYGMATRFM